MGVLLSVVALVLVVGQVDALQDVGQGATTGALATFFDTPVMITLLVLGVVAVMAAVLAASRL